MAKIEARAVLPAGSWREPRAYVHLAMCGARGLAWELLRRDPAYGEAVAGERAAHPDAEDGGRLLSAAGPAFAARWGLHFR